MEYGTVEYCREAYQQRVGVTYGDITEYRPTQNGVFDAPVMYAGYMIAGYRMPSGVRGPENPPTLIENEEQARAVFSPDAETENPCGS